MINHMIEVPKKPKCPVCGILEATSKNGSSNKKSKMDIIIDGVKKIWWSFILVPKKYEHNHTNKSTQINVTDYYTLNQ